MRPQGNVACLPLLCQGLCGTCQEFITMPLALLIILYNDFIGAPELTSFKRVAPDSLTSIPEDRTTVEVEVSFPPQTMIIKGSGFMSSVVHSKSVDSCLSLSDVEIGLEDSGHFGEFEEVDSPHVVEMSPHIPQQVHYIS